MWQSLECNNSRHYEHLNLLNDEEDNKVSEQWDIFFRELEMILKAFQVFRGDIGYVQGMTQLVYLLHHVFRDEFATFNAFCSLILKHFPLYEFYTFDKHCLGIFSDCLRHFVCCHCNAALPRVSFFVENLAQSMLYSSILTLFTGYLEERDVFWLLDLYLAQNFSVFIYVTVLISVSFLQHGPQSLNLSDIKQYSKNLGLHGLLAYGRKLKLRLQDIIELFEKKCLPKQRLGSMVESDQSTRLFPILDYLNIYLEIQMR